MRSRPLLGILIAALLAGGGWVAWTATARPQIIVLPLAVDFGRVTERQTKGVEVRNAGRAALRILAVTASCGCTTPRIGAMVVPRGGHTVLSITFDPVAHGPQSGPARHAVYLRTSDPRTPETEIEVRADVVKGTGQ